MHIEGMANYRDLAVDYLRLVIAQTGKSATELAGLAGVSSTTFTRPLNNPDFKYGPKFATLRALSKETGVPLTPALTATSQDLLTDAQKRRPIGTLEVRGIVAAGVWREVFMQLDQPMGASPFVENPTYAEFRQWAELVEGPSMNKHYLPGDFLHVVSTIDSGYAPKYGDHVIVERRDGNKIERTCKVYERRNGNAVLVGDSTDPRWNEPLVLGASASESTEIEIVGKVLGFYRPS